MSAGDSARVFYELAKRESVERVRLRDNVLLLYIGAITTIFSFAMGREDLEILLVIPFMTLGAVIIISQHNAVIGTLSAYCASEIGPFLKSLTPPEDAPQWDTSKALKTYSGYAITMRTVGHSLLTLLPACIALYLNRNHATDSPFPNGPVWWFGALFLMISGVVVWVVHGHRKRILRRLLKEQTPF